MTTLKELQNSLILKYGSFKEELVEQTMAYNFINEHAVVLELGSNIGSNILIISKILINSSNLVTLEMDKEFSDKCEENKIANNLNFHINIIII